MQKNFDDLTIVDDYMFCTVMQDEELCKELLSMILKIRGVSRLTEKSKIIKNGFLLALWLCRM